VLLTLKKYPLCVSLTYTNLFMEILHRNSSCSRWT